ncbi:unnamed protein product [Linum trigynum]|uniref:Uncharacterized protein n=1 Tax=Linum trigynum TaxID=586398 RepID=A0AAV2D6K4_9ROSI
MGLCVGTHGIVRGHARPCNIQFWPCELAEVQLIDTPRFEVHGQNGDVHGRAPWPCESGMAVFNPNSSQRRGRAGFWIPNTQGTNPRERERLGNILGAILEDFFAIGARESSLEMEIEDLDQISAVSLFSME